VRGKACKRPRLLSRKIAHEPAKEHAVLIFLRLLAVKNRFKIKSLPQPSSRQLHPRHHTITEN
jgi:hypothetical protein